jgi:hypothetical protein
MALIAICIADRAGSAAWPRPCHGIGAQPLRAASGDGEDRPRRRHAAAGEVLEQIVAKTEGMPLFVEELTKTLPESGLMMRRGE